MSLVNNNKSNIVITIKAANNYVSVNHKNVLQYFNSTINIKPIGPDVHGAGTT